ncbi:MAG: HD-GYP domain-containing protein [Aminipila sp.]
MIKSCTLLKRREYSKIKKLWIKRDALLLTSRKEIDMQNYKVQISNKNIIIKKEYFLIFSTIFSVITAISVYLSGGTFNVYTNFMYIPVAIVAATNGIRQGVINAVVSAILIGPLMPLEVSKNIMQSPSHYMIRLLIYSVIAVIIGYFAEERSKEFQKNIDNQKEINEEQIAMIFALVKLSESRDNYLDMHIERVGTLCRFLASKVGNVSKYSAYVNNNDYVEDIFKASQLHDIGKVGIPDRILLKQGKLSTEEFDIMKKHATIGANTLQEVKDKYPHNKFLNMAINIAQFHHEKWDGTGYPKGLAGENIPLSARIMALVDVYDALRTKRVYKEAYSHSRSLEIIKQGEGVQFDPIISQVFFENENEFKSIYEKLVTNEVNIKVS